MLCWMERPLTGTRAAYLHALSGLLALALALQQALHITLVMCIRYGYLWILVLPVLQANTPAPDVGTTEALQAALDAMTAAREACQASLQAQRNTIGDCHEALLNSFKGWPWRKDG